MPPPKGQEAVFLCDAMLGGLARWLRAIGYDAQFEYGIEDREIVQRALATGATLLSSDSPMFERNVIRSGTVKALFIPRQMSVMEQLRFVMGKLALPIRPPRCMACGGELEEIPKHSVMEEAPPLAYRNCAQFWRCRRCRKLFWHGTHWQKIAVKLAELPPDDPAPEKR